MINRIHYKDLIKLVEEDVQAYGVCDRIFRLTLIFEGNYKDLYRETKRCCKL